MRWRACRAGAGRAMHLSAVPTAILGTSPRMTVERAASRYLHSAPGSTQPLAPPGVWLRPAFGSTKRVAPPSPRPVAQRRTRALRPLPDRRPPLVPAGRALVAGRNPQHRRVVEIPADELDRHR